MSRTMTMRFVTWNLKYSGWGHSPRRLEHLKTFEWDVLALQEVSRKAWDVFTKGGITEDGLYALDGFGLEPEGRQPHGVALLVQNGFSLSEPELVPGIPKLERALAARLHGLGQPVTIVSWHAPNASGEGRGVKMQGYRAITDWLCRVKGSLVLGFDGNHWNTSTSLEPPKVVDTADPWYPENSFFGADPPHGLRDAFLNYLKQHPGAYQEAIAKRPEGPLAVSHVRKGSAKKPIEDRFDYVFVSEEWDVNHCQYEYAGPRAAGSDHGTVTADLRLRT